ncbi:hypothetical protein A3K64_03900 [Candidatus Micrarchaeota archaeon RBG_16_36_9]|nr:MAG: hypothetical protein A3K64_03900 [Candidatus Micrarchaeota archaeon RBG_16_36_9]
MKKNIVFILLFFLFFSLYFKLAGSDATFCHIYVNGVCQTWINYDTTGQERQTSEAPTQISNIFGDTSNFSITLVTLIFQLLGMIILFVLLVIMIEELAKSL